jgi:hypothetical protein
LCCGLAVLMASNAVAAERVGPAIDARAAPPDRRTHYDGPPDFVVWLCGESLEITVVPKGKSEIVGQWYVHRRPTEPELTPIVAAVRALFSGKDAVISPAKEVLLYEIKQIMFALAKAGFSDLSFVVLMSPKSGPTIPHCAPKPVAAR